MRTSLLCIFAFAGCSLGQTPPVVHLSVGTVSNQTQFHIGQRISITLDFAMNGEGSVQADTGMRLRQLRPQGLDQVSVTPQDGWRDPLARLTWTMDGRYRQPSTRMVDRLHPLHIERALNELVVFQNPGQYMIHVASSRIPGQVLQSGELRLEILPRDNAWTEGEFQQARAILETGKPPREPEQVFYLEKENAQTDAIRKLRYLDTASATEYLASLLGEGRRSTSELETALYASQFPQVAAQRLEKEIQLPDFAPHQSFMITLQVLKAQASVLQNGHDLSITEHAAISDAVDGELLEAAAQKSLVAKADSYFYLLVLGSKSYRNNPEIRLKLIELLPSVSDFNLYSLLTAFWTSIKDGGPALIPALKEISARPTPPQGFNVSEPALRRLNEIGSLAPAKSP